MLPRLDRIRERAAATTPADPIATEWFSEQRDMRCVLREAGPDEVELLIETLHPLTANHIFHVRVATAERNLDYFLLPTVDTSGLHVADLLIPGVGRSLKVAVLATRPTSSLGLDDVVAVRRSVRGTGRAGRNAWRAVARQRPAGDPVQEAIVAEL
ncbi:MAG: hypothetical protein WBF75_12040 [Pseudonocardiaceae bacterium]